MERSWPARSGPGVTRGSASKSHGVESSDRRSEHGMRALARSTGVEAAAPLGASVRVAIKPPSVAAARPHKKRGRGELVRSPAACPSAAAPSPRRSPLGERNGERDSNHRSCAVDRTPPTGFASQMCGVGVVAPHSTQVAGRVLNMLNKACPRRGALSTAAKASRHDAVSARALCRRSRDSRERTLLRPP